MSRTFLFKTLTVVLTIGLVVYALLQPDEVSRAQTSGFDRSQYANDRPVGDLEAAQDQLPETGEFDVMIELVDQPTARIYVQSLGNRNDKGANAQLRASARSSARAQMARIKGSQQRVLAQLATHGRFARTLYTVQTAYNGIAARIDASILPQLRANADVKGVYALPVHTIENSSSVPFIKAQQAWQATGGNSGDGIKIAVIDTGTDYTHANF